MKEDLVLTLLKSESSALEHNFMKNFNNNIMIMIFMMIQ